jgi:hypothetical protein
VIYPLGDIGKLRLDIDDVKKAVKRVAGQGIHVELTSDQSGVRIAVTGKTSSYTDRNRLRTAIVTALSDKLPFRK